MKVNHRESKIHLAFEVSIILKGIHAIVEMLGGILAFFITKEYIISKVLSITQDELDEDPKDVISHYLINASTNFSISSQHFIAFYLLSHGLIQLFLVAGLLKKRLWAYPTSLVVFSLFIIYQLYRFNNTHSAWLLLFTLLDIFIIWLTFHEYHFMKKNNLFHKV